MKLFLGNEAQYGGSLYAERFSNVTSTSTKFANNIASSSGGAIFISNSTLTLDNTTVQSNEARKDCGGVCAIKVSKVLARNLTILSNTAKNVGGGIGIGNGSSILCYACNISNNNAFSGAGLHVSINDLILIVAQLQNSNFEKNSARSYGSGITFITPMNRINSCNSSNDTCGHIVLLNTNFEGNRASPNGVSIPTINTNGVLIDCKYKGGSSQDFLNQTILSSLDIYDPRKSCLQREGDLLHMSEDGDIIGTLNQVITLSIARDDDEVGLIWNAIDGYMLKNVSSGRQLPRIYITVLNGFGEDLSFSLPNSFVARLYSSDRLFYGEYFTDSFIGSGHFSNATLFARPGNYSLEIRSNLPPIWAINVTVIVRECFVGEEAIEDPFTCQSCDALSYKFAALNISGCTPCPLGGSCQGRYIVPKKGYWHKSPCHNNTQKCIVEEACSHDDRIDVLMNFTTNFTDCSMNETELEAYSEKLCNKGYQGPLCGSCNQTFGLSSRFMCRECTSNILSLLVIIGVTLYLLGATVVTIRGCLPSNLTHRESHLETYQSLNVARPSDIDQQVNIQMAETNDEGNVPQEQLAPNNSINISETEASKLQQETEFELTRWKITEIFKIMINFLQTTGVAASIDVPWAEEMNTMFATSDFIGALTTDAISRPVDCLVSSDSTSLKALWRMMVSNEARYGGALYAALFNIVTTTCTKFSNNTARSTGGAISVKNTTLTLENTTIQLNEARKDCGGVCAIEVSEVFARNVTIHSNVAKNVGGGIGIGNGSSILCYACNISNNNAFSGAGLHVSINDLILIVVQLQNSNFENNSVRSYGSGTTFTTPMKRINNCNSSNDTCGHIVLLNINFEGNRASPNGVTIPTLNTNGVLIDCEYKRGSAQDFLNQTILSSLEQYDPKKSCLQRERDLLHVNDDGVIVGTLSQVITLSIAHDNDEVGLIWNAIDGYILKNVSSGRQLPRIYITVLNGFGGDLMFSLPNSFVARLYSSDRLFYGEYFTDSFIGSGHFSNATLFARPGNYSLEIRSNLPPIWAINVTVNVRECFVGEEPIEDPFTCQLCDALSYNFDASNISRCTPCPLDGSCQGRYIVPKKGHWHKSPCHNNTQKCIVEEACSLDDRTDVLMNFTANFTNCNMNETELDTYSEKLCHKGYQGPLCGSCNQTFGLSSRFMCRECTSNILSLLVIIGVTLYLLGATVVTIRGCLPSNLTHRESHLETYQSLNVARPSDIDQQVNIQMAETNDDGNVPQEQLATNDSINTSETETSKLQQETEFKVTRWKITEIFKIMINFLQTTGVAATLNVPWTEEMNTMFATSDYIGGLTTDAISRPVDCLVSSGSTSLKALWRIMVSVSIPLIVLGILTSFWGYITIKNGKDRQHFLKRFILSAISVAYISYLGLTKMAVRAFYCVDVYDSVDHLEQSTTRLWAVDTSIRCYEEDHAGIIVIAVLVLLLITICYPLLSFIALYINKENVRSGDKGIFEIAGFLFRAFKEKFLFWESIVMLRKACLSVICVFSYSLGGDSQLLLVSVLLFFCLYLQLTLRPYREDFKILNHFESISLLVSGLTFSLGQFFIEGRCNDYIKTFLVVLLIFGNSMFFLLLLLALFYNSMVHLRVTLQCENIPLPVPPIWWNILKVYIHSRYTKWRQLHN
eukprot:g3760.t1